MRARAEGMRDFGAVLSAQSAFYLLQGLETLPLRMDRHCQNALAIARHLEGHKAVARVNYAGLESSPYYDLGRKYLPKGAGSVFTIELAGGFEAAKKMVEGVELFSHLANIGDAKSLILHPASTTHNQLSAEQQTAAGAGPEMVRLSVGLETVEDLIEDLDRALGLAGA
jgi:O-acetylhomoserine (thiol)-lyase